MNKCQDYCGGFFVCLFLLLAGSLKDTKPLKFVFILFWGLGFFVLLSDLNNVFRSDIFLYCFKNKNYYVSLLV